MALRNQPYIPLYVQDFMTDEKLIECSAESVGVYIRLMCVLHKSEEYGTLSLNTRNERSDDVCLDFAKKLLHYLPYDLNTILSGITELRENGVIQIDGNKLSQKRMVKDGSISEARALAGFAGGKARSDRSKTTSKIQTNHQAKQKQFTENETATVIEDDTGKIRNNGLFSDSESDLLLQNAQQLNAVFDAAERAGFPHTQADLDRLNLIVADYGTEPVLNAIDRAVDQGESKRTWAYLRGILKSDPTGGTRGKAPAWEPALPPDFEG